MEKNMEYYIEISHQIMLKNLKNRKLLINRICDEYANCKNKKICIIASGSSLNSAITAKPFMKKVMKTDVDCISPTEYMYYQKEVYKNSFIIIISQSGCSTNIIEATKKLNHVNANYVALTGNMDGDLKSYAPILIEYGVGNEIIDYVTLGMVTLVEFLMLFALESAVSMKGISIEEYNNVLEDMEKACWANKNILDSTKKFVKKHKDILLQMDKVIIATDGANIGAGREGALKFQETLRIPALYYESEEYVHGPDMQLTPEYAVFFVDTNKQSNRIYDVYQATKLITNNTFMITNKDLAEEDNIIGITSDVMNELTPLFTLVPFQYISANITPEKNEFKCHPLFDKFEEKIKCKTDDYEDTMKKKIEKAKESL